MNKVVSPKLTFTVQVFKEGRSYVSYNPELKVASCGDTVDEAKNNLRDAIRGFMKSAQKLGTLEEILEEAGYMLKHRKWVEPQLVVLDRLSLAV
ncbi:MAG: hypothetical protein V1704_04385 [Candidatus Vogelbacteria bacterium]